MYLDISYHQVINIKLLYLNVLRNFCHVLSKFKSNIKNARLIVKQEIQNYRDPFSPLPNRFEKVIAEKLSNQGTDSNRIYLLLN